jgi:hypothetical protein
LIKVVAQAIRKYLISCLKLPRGLSQIIDSQFLVGQSRRTKENVLGLMEEMAMPKYAGGLGYKLDLLARLAWRLLQNPKTLSAQILKVILLHSLH